VAEAWDNSQVDTPGKLLAPAASTCISGRWEASALMDEPFL